MMTKTTELQRHRLAQALAAARPDWELRGIDTALRTAIENHPNETYPQLAVAAFRAAERAGNLTPAVIAMPGPHRQAPTPPDQRNRVPLTDDRLPWCETHQQHSGRRPDGELACCYADRIEAPPAPDTPGTRPDHTRQITAARTALDKAGKR